VGRNRVYASDAERQKAHRQRVAAQPLKQRQPENLHRRQPSRPAKLAAVRATVLQLFDDYEDWLASIPESLQDTTQAHRLGETVDQLAAILDLIAELELPRGFGRD
jgi:hypothetical protein